MTKMDESCQQPIDEDQLVFRPAAHGPLPWPRDQLGLVALMPQRTYLSHEFSDHIARQASSPTVADDHCTSPVPHHPTMINHHRLDASPLVAHELVGQDQSLQVRSTLCLFDQGIDERAGNGRS
ncbi:hypothetical protein [Streptomyces sp. NPDC058632]|uniref:hypothetical protein n=1 Tax=Streptomyces sp. NPDC058632 TaxID=3346567 RepID=UPI003668B624